MLEEFRLLESLTDDDEDTGLPCYEVRFDDDAQNMNEVFKDRQRAIQYAKRNIENGPVVYYIDEEGNETIEVEFELDESVDTLPNDSAYLYARTGDKVCYNGRCYQVNADEGKIGYSAKIGLTDCETGEKIVLDKSTFAKEVKMYRGECGSIDIVEELQERDWNSDNEFDLYNSYCAADLDASRKCKLAEMLVSNASNKDVLDLIEGVSPEDLEDKTESDTSVQAVNHENKIAQVNKKIKELQAYMEYLTTYAVREVGRGGAFDTKADLDEVVEETKAALAKLETELVNIDA